MNYFVNPSPETIKKFFLDESTSSAVSSAVSDILRQVKTNGDKALFDLTFKFDGVDLSRKGFLVDKEEITSSLAQADPKLIEALEAAKKNIVRYHEHQKRQNWQYEIGYGSYIREIIVPVEKAGIYIPGGTAPLVSTVLMSALPAIVAGVTDVIVVTPPQKDGSVNKGVLAACALCDIYSVYAVGGAQAIAALAYGTESIPKVDIIAGPGNQYVTEAKRQVYGTVGIDMIAGPSEVLILADNTANPEYVAIDLLSQLEHSKDTKAICISTSKQFLEKLEKTIQTESKKVSRKDIIATSMETGLALIEVDTMDTMITLANCISPEHLEIMLKNPARVADKITSAGVIFLGEYTPEAVGDYIAGPSHVLPTGGNARFFHGLSVYHFTKKVSILYYSKEKLDRDASYISTIALCEGLDAHSQSVLKRCEDLQK